MTGKKEFVVFGLGKFGDSLARTLAEAGCEVIAVDKDEERVQAISDAVTYAVNADATDANALEELGISNLDCAIVAISDDMEASILATILAKDAGVPKVVAKAINDIHKKILEKVGADLIVFPEKEMGARVGRTLVSGSFVDSIELSKDISIVETYAKKRWVGQTLRELNVREQYNVNIIALKNGQTIDVSPNPDLPLEENQHMILIGRNKDLERIDMDS